MSDPQPQFPDEFYARYLFFAQADLHSAERLFQDAEGFWHLPCFSSRECVEKALKAFIEASGKRAQPAHGLRTLLGSASQQTRNSADFCGIATFWRLTKLRLDILQKT